MSSYTSNLNLLKKDPTTDGSDTFNIKTMLNDNWDKIDDYVAKRKKNIVYIEESQNWTVPSGVYEVAVFLIGGGCGGQGAYNNGDSMYSSGRGGTGGYPIADNIKVIPGTNISIIIGAGSAGGIGNISKSGTKQNPEAGGTTSFGNILFAKGGALDIGGSAGGKSIYYEQTSKIAHIKGQDGGDNNGLGIENIKRTSFCDITNELYGGGGGSGCWINDKNLTETVSGGIGGIGGGTGGSSENLSGQNATKYGAGGGGGGFLYASAPGTCGNGGNGHAGVCIIAY